MPSEMTNLCARLEAWLASRFPAALESFNPPATKRQITAFERAVRAEMPEDFRDWFRWRNGQKPHPDQSILMGSELLSLKDSAKEWKSWQTVADMNAQVSEVSKSTPEGAIQLAYSLPGWIPWAKESASSNYYGIDLNPGPKGTVGQVISFGRDNHYHMYVGGSSLTASLEFLVEEMEAGRVSIRPLGMDYPDVERTCHDYFHPGLIGVATALWGIWAALHLEGAYDGRRHHVSPGRPHIVPLSMERGDRLARAHNAALNSDAEYLRQLLETDPELATFPDDGGQTVQHLAARVFAVEALEYLATLGLDWSIESKIYGTPLSTCEKQFADDHRYTPPTAEEQERFRRSIEIIQAAMNPASNRTDP